MSSINSNINRHFNRFDRSESLLEDVVKKYPASSLARMLLLKKYKDTEHPGYEGLKNETALYMSNMPWYLYLLYQAGVYRQDDVALTTPAVADAANEHGLSSEPEPETDQQPEPINEPAENIPFADETITEDSQPDVSDDAAASLDDEDDVTAEFPSEEADIELLPGQEHHEETGHPDEIPVPGETELVEADMPEVAAIGETFHEDEERSDDAVEVDVHGDMPADTGADEVDHNESGHGNQVFGEGDNEKDLEDGMEASSESVSEPYEMSANETYEDQPHPEEPSPEEVPVEGSYEQDLPVTEEPGEQDETGDKQLTDDDVPVAAFDPEGPGESDSQQQDTSKSRAPDDQEAGEKQIEEQPGELEFEPLYTVDYFASQGIRLNEQDLKDDKLSQQVKSFTGWLKSMKKLHPGRLPEQNEVIEKIIQNAAEVSNVESDVLTEAMAEVLVKQNKKDKAIEMYHKLSLMNPSKSAYFAAKIDNLKTT